MNVGRRKRMKWRERKRGWNVEKEVKGAQGLKEGLELKQPKGGAQEQVLELLLCK